MQEPYVDVDCCILGSSKHIYGHLNTTRRSGTRLKRRQCAVPVTSLVVRSTTVKITPCCCLSEKWRIINLLDNIWMLLPEVESLGSWRKAAVGQVWLQSSELRTASFHDFGDNFKLQEQLSGGSVVVVHEEPHPQMTGTLSYRPEETGGRQRGEIARHTTQATGRPISRFTVARRLHGGGLFARRPVRCVPLTPAHRRRRSLWCREHRNWRDKEWGRVLFTDESRFSLSSDSHRILIWRERGSRNHPSNIIERDRYGGRGVLV
ncbi:transposable element Tc1 transposase [Trichonephila clavipes]|nr:transposable element Tc1 transposase [Trichonephila clavipes]